MSSISASFAQRKTNSFVTLQSVWIKPYSSLQTALNQVGSTNYTDLCGVYVFNSAASLTTFQNEFGSTGASFQVNGGTTLTDMGVQFTAEVDGTNDFATYRLVKAPGYKFPDEVAAVGFVLIEDNFSDNKEVKVARV